MEAISGVLSAGVAKGSLEAVLAEKWALHARQWADAAAADADAAAKLCDRHPDDDPLLADEADAGRQRMGGEKDLHKDGCKDVAAGVPAP